MCWNREKGWVTLLSLLMVVPKLGVHSGLHNGHLRAVQENSAMMGWEAARGSLTDSCTMCSLYLEISFSSQGSLGPSRRWKMTTYLPLKA